MGIEVVTAEGAEEALSILEDQSIDIVIADYRMPGMQGDALLEKVRVRWPETVRILNTGLAQVSVVEQAVRRGAIFRLLLKPCEIDMLRLAIDDALDLRRRLLEKKRASVRQRAELLNYQRIFHRALDAMMVSDLEGNLIEVNEAFLRGASCEREQALARRPTIMSGWQQASRWPEIRETLLAEGYWSDEVKHVDGERYALLSISTVLDDDGAPNALVAIEKDVSTWKQLVQESRAAQYEVILSLAKMAEYRDPETFLHLERIRGYSRLLAQRLAATSRYRKVIDDAYVEAIAASSPLHDVGKVGIPDAVLLKPGPLTEEEWRVMRLHTTIGAEVLSVSSGSRNRTWLEMARTIALQHHEQFDGSGYPSGLEGETIDLSARIVALADSYDAITSRRVYKGALSHEQARTRLLEASGTHFDPEVVKAFVAAEGEFLRISRQHADASAPGGQDDSLLSRVNRLRADA